MATRSKERNYSNTVINWAQLTISVAATKETQTREGQEAPLSKVLPASERAV